MSNRLIILSILLLGGALFLACGGDNNDQRFTNTSPLLGPFNKLDCRYQFNGGFSGSVDFTRSGGIGLSGSFEGTINMRYSNQYGAAVNALYQMELSFGNNGWGGKTSSSRENDSGNTQPSINGQADVVAKLFENNVYAGTLHYEGDYRGQGSELSIETTLTTNSNSYFNLNCQAASVGSLGMFN